MSKSTCPLRSVPVPDDSRADSVAPLHDSNTEPRHDLFALRSVARPDTLTSQHVEVGIVLNAMLGFSAANDYLMRHEIGNDVITRVLSVGGPRRGKHDASGIRLVSQTC